jgi:dTDP-4-dehydrorhamnose reductase
MDKKRVLITGVSGLLGSNLAFCWKEKFDILGIYNSHPVSMQGVQLRQMDLLEPKAVKSVMEGFDPQVVVHCAALVDMDACQKDQDLAYRMNVGMTDHLCAHLPGKSKLVYISTDAVYDGVKGDFSEEDPANPLSHYARTKLQGETRAGRVKGSLIARTSFYGWSVGDKRSLGEWVVHELSQNHHILGFQDIISSNIYTMELARLLAMAIEKDLQGVYNFGSADAMSKYAFVRQVALRFGLDAGLIEPSGIGESALKAPRGRNLSLDVSKLRKALAVHIPAGREMIDLFYRDFQMRVPEKIKI